LKYVVLLSNLFVCGGEVKEHVDVCAFLRYPYFDIVVGLAWTDDPESYAGGIVATGRVCLAGQVKGDNPD
jgi:hypothetical protein